ncbi:Clavaminate synthase-like protein [Glarea lozoyensis ATCC 20868]|uniref:Clavaminate synthase-like protein n=2 Tax=Glarea lozoyensis TaxID=101852 RepID=S3DLI3_GLAL2|nr:Clavaminate synthase-like protein [Glarea lozoyensis ATCC 20868]EHL01873.1 hypothetical protein M7I_2230 [Glarea lozoyensis 74030]EPE27408.1 Clavaminate synthase-like protein [Glarea lozoyensis ATCC 20868]
MPHSLTELPDTTKSYGDFRDDLFRDGFVVIKEAISEDSAEKYKDSMIQWLETFPLGFDRHNPDTWTEENLPAHWKGGMYHGYSVAHEKFVWDARQEPGVLDAFKTIWGTDELLSSFDGINLTLPPPGPSPGPGTPWEHVDQSPHLKGIQCIQGILNLCPNGNVDGGLMVLKGSHVLNEKFFKIHGTEKKAEWGVVPDDWHGFNAEERKWFEENGAVEVKVNCGPGDLILWDSRLVHWNVRPVSKQTRALFYVCYTPASFSSKEELAKKKQIFEARERTTHWPHRNFWKADKIQRFGKADLLHRDRPSTEPELTDKLLKLAGAKPYCTEVEA